MTTIHDVAELAGLSVATVSRVLNNSDYVSEAARKKVNEAIAELDYYPNEVARSLSQNKSNIIGLLLPNIQDPFYPELAKGVEDQVNKRGYSLLLGNVEGNSQKEADYLKIFSQNNVAGVVNAMAGQKERLDAMPMVLVDQAHEADYMVYADDYRGGQLAAEAIIERQAKEIVIVAGPQTIFSAQERLAGNRLVLDRAGINYSVFQTKSYQLADAEEAAQNFFKKHGTADSVIAPNDIYAMALMTEAIERGRKVPEDFQIIGYDDIFLSRMLYPALSTIAQPAYQLGYQGAKLLCDLLEKKEIKEKQKELAVQLIIRDSLRKREINGE